MRHDKLREWAEDTTIPSDEVVPHQARADRSHTPSQQTVPELFPEDNQEEPEKFDPDAGLYEEEEEQAQVAAPSPEDEFDVKARQMGWVTKGEWRGNPDDWTPAKRFVQTGEMIQANRSLHQKVDYLESDFNNRLSNMRMLHEAQLKTSIDQLKTERDDAVALADTDKYHSLNKQIETLEETNRGVQTPIPNQSQQQQEQQPQQQPSTPAQAAPDPTKMMQNLFTHPVVKTWMNKNPWVSENSPKTAYAERQFVQWVNQNIATPGATIEQGLQFVEDSLSREFPKVSPNRNKPTMAEKRGGPVHRSSNVTLSMNDLNREERLIWQTMGTTWRNQADFLRAVQDDREATRDDR